MDHIWSFGEKNLFHNSHIIFKAVSLTKTAKHLHNQSLSITQHEFKKIVHNFHGLVQQRSILIDNQLIHK